MTVVTGDPEDDYVLATARVGSADYLVTGDKELLGLQQFHGTRIVSPREFLFVLEGTGDGESDVATLDA
ncbi:MAG: putative toxin-antitoxin system toxin component, PIN family [Chloroflexota bacterium]